MKEAIFIFLFLIPVLTGYGGSVLWNFAYISQFSETSHGDHGYDCWLHGANLEMMADRVGTAWQLFAIPDSNLEYANTFVIAARGDVVSDGYFSSKDSYFAYARYGDSGSTHSDYSISVDMDTSVYLAFRQESGRYDFATYGWVELAQNANGELNVVSSAWAGYGDSLVVGAIPEPTSAVLLLLGCAGLLLRRHIYLES